ncbi:MAG: ATP-dependent DNA helicase RecQ [Verrucomicrobiales bacterium]|nr:ATP-dependent DNA helicase RecQ [Verrucomicrobiales bacterium]
MSQSPGTGAPPRDPLAVLEQHFGYRRFLDGQGAVVAAILQGRDALVIMPTGGGKSLCYQLPALMMDGVTVVVSPLIALMKDQVDALERRGIPATMINSTLNAGEQHRRINALRRGEFKLVYVAPERFRHRAFLDALRGVEIALFAIDEAHCISQWGHDFRPDYLRLGQALERMGNPQTVALTATATPVVRQDILAQLRLQDPFLSVFGFSRPNLSLNIRPVSGGQEKFDRLRTIVRQHKTGIIYCSTRGKVEEVHETLRDWRLSCVAYHGGMHEAERTAAQNLFMRRERDVVVATNAFGMGIDRPDVRFVAHFDICGSIEAYYQEAGRAGRDGEPAFCELLFNYADTRTQEFFIDGNNPKPDIIRDLYGWLRDHRDAQHQVRVTIDLMAQGIGSKNSMAVGSALSVLVRGGFLERFELPGTRTRGTRLLRPEVTPQNLDLDWAALQEKERRDREKLKQMVGFAYSSGCRQKYILDHFGEGDAGECGNCDQCAAGGLQRRIRDASAEELLIVRKALSGLARTNGRFGRAKIIGMLTGSRDREVLGARLDELSTYGLLKEQGTSYLQSLFREMEAAGLVSSSQGEYPVLTLTPAGAEIMKSGGPCRWRWPEPRQKKSTPPPVDGEIQLTRMGFDEVLFQKLKACRNEQARSLGVPPFCIFSNNTLEAMTRLRPDSRPAALRIHGISDTKADKHLAPLLEIIRQHPKTA